jgi:hypothetical protein
MRLRKDALIAALGISIGMTACGSKEPAAPLAPQAAVTGPVAAPSAPPAGASFEASFGISPYPGAKLIAVSTGNEPGNSNHYRTNSFSSPDAMDKVVAYYRDQMKRYTAGAPAPTGGDPPFDEQDRKEDGFSFAVADNGSKPGFAIHIIPLNSGPGTQISIEWKPVDNTQP